MNHIDATYAAARTLIAALTDASTTDAARSLLMTAELHLDDAISGSVEVAPLPLATPDVTDAARAFDELNVVLADLSAAPGIDGLEIGMCRSHVTRAEAHWSDQ